MILTLDKIIDDYKEDMAAKKYHLAFLIMLPFVMLIAALGKSIPVGIIFMLIMLIVILIKRGKEKKTLRALEAQDFRLVQDILLDKQVTRPKRNSHIWHIQTKKLFFNGLEVIPTIYDAVEVNDAFVAILVNDKFVTLYNLKTYKLSDTLNEMLEV